MENIFDKLNQQISYELYASNCYLQLYSFFDNQNIALKNIANYFKKQSDEEREHANLIIEYINKRGGVVNIMTVNKPDINLSSLDIITAFKFALYIENKILESLNKIMDYANSTNDHHLGDFITSIFLKEQIDSINEIKKYITQINSCCSNNIKYGSYLFDKYFK